MTGSKEELWEQLGQLSESEGLQVLTSLYQLYEEVEGAGGEDRRQAELFFRRLAIILEQTLQCNVRRR